MLWAVLILGLLLVGVLLMGGGAAADERNWHGVPTTDPKKYSLGREIQRKYAEINELKRRSADFSLSSEDRQEALSELYDKEIEAQSMLNQFFDEEGEN